MFFFYESHCYGLGRITLPHPLEKGGQLAYCHRQVYEAGVKKKKLLHYKSFITNDMQISFSCGVGLIFSNSIYAFIKGYDKMINCLTKVV
jgi:hypothetical protein